jgi:thiol-disulfide isomerase/thioredoxin
MNRHRRSARLLVVAVVTATLGLALTACGGGESPAASATVADTAVPPATDAVAGTTPSDRPTATVAPDLPADYRGEIGPVAVVGDALPALGGASLDTDPALGLQAPALYGQDYDGNPTQVAFDTGRPTMVLFLAHWCPHCNAEVPRINELRDAGRFPADLQIVAVSTAVAPGRPNFPPSKWIDDVDWTYPVIADGVDIAGQTFLASDAYGVDGFPFITLLHGDGTVAARWSGESEPDEIIARIDQYLGTAA